ncbi:hypothetical protein EVAR_21443_1 [Eumeta japonica]|uniref:Uncharacterized protein n=1 Tax=Eumeta variegata TaxID=151549 RepID=A0A4C1VHX8_EUMVA|nr:hypothetical protein EVAR_21443_1 [Eumeta japonica]
MKSENHEHRTLIPSLSGAEWDALGIPVSFVGALEKGTVSVFAVTFTLSPTRSTASPHMLLLPSEEGFRRLRRELCLRCDESDGSGLQNKPLKRGAHRSTMTIIITKKV